MEYRTLENLNIKTSLLGFGTMRLPIQNNDNSKIDEKASIEMIRHAIDEGVNYVDTAYMYHDGNSEEVLGKALKNGYRKKVYIADKMPAWFAKSEDDIIKIFENQLKRLDVNTIDFYLVHNVTESIWKLVEKYNVMDFLEKMKSQGKIKYIGFSFHDSLDVFKKVIDSYPWDFCQIQLNYMDTEFQAGIEGLRYASSKNIPIIVMEPLKGGRLAAQPPAPVQKIWDKANNKYTPVEWALKWVANFPEVKVILSGMGSLKQVKDNIRILKDMKPNSLTENDLETIDEAKSMFSKLISVDCTACNYCMPCPSKVNIPKAFSYLNDISLYNMESITLREFNNFTPLHTRPSACTECGQCESHCPQQLPIIELLKKARKVLEKK